MHAAIAVRDTELPQGLGNLLQDGTVIVIRQAMNDGPNSVGDISSRGFKLQLRDPLLQPSDLLVFRVSGRHGGGSATLLVGHHVLPHFRACHWTDDGVKNQKTHIDRLTWSVTGDNPIVGDDRRILEYRPCCPKRGEVVSMAVGVCGGTLAAQQARFGDHLVPGTQRRERSALRVHRAQDRVDSRIEDLSISVIGEAPRHRHRPVVGWIDAVGPTTMTLVIRGDSVIVIPLDAVDRLELSVKRWNRGTRVKRAAGTGALAGFIPGLLIGLATTRDCSGEFLCLRELTILFSGMLGSLAGAGIGAIIGSQQPTDHWQTAEFEAIQGLSPEIPQPNGRR